MFSTFILLLCTGEFMNKLKQWLCGWTGHRWTSSAMQDKTPTKEQINDGIEGFYDYATMYCERCGHVCDLSKKRSI